jgi:hypothetical protein
MAPLKTTSQAASEAIILAKILVAVDIRSSPPLSAINPSRISCLNALLVLGGDALLAPLLNSCQPVLECVHVAWRAAFAFQACHFVSFPVGRFIFP